MEDIMNSMGGGSTVISLDALLSEMSRSINIPTTIKELVEDSQWQAQLFNSLQPNDLGRIMTKVLVDFDQARVAALIAPAVSGFGVNHIVALMNAGNEFMKVQIVQKTLPFCTDLQQNCDALKGALTDWEKICLEKDIDMALAA
mmetsp:Transcript_14406/g.21158  ORF Transcript_14406/g.21158 Transcript_14406/m.21158 type:complete len:144 (-) Transcript_14406:274-705(-)